MRLEAQLNQGDSKTVVFLFGISFIQPEREDGVRIFYRGGGGGSEP